MQECSAQMFARQQTSRLVHDVQQSLASYQPRRAGLDREQLGGLAKAVLASVDVRDLRGLDSAQLLPQLESMLTAIEQRKRDEIKVSLQYEEGIDALVVETCLEDQPFLVSTLRAALASEHYDVRRFMNAVVKIRRDAGGKLLAIGTGTPESVMRVEVGLAGGSAGRDGGGVPQGLAARIEHRLRLAQAMVTDFGTMKEIIKRQADAYYAAALRHLEREGYIVQEWLSRLLGQPLPTLAQPLRVADKEAQRQ